MKKQQISVVEAAAALRLSYNQTLRLILIGALKGARVNGRWTVDPRDIERLRLQDDPAGVTSAAVRKEE